MSIQIDHISSSSLSGQQQTFTGALVKFGRRPDNDVVFDPHQDRTVSGYHAELSSEGDVITLRDLDTNNGTWVNGSRLSAPVTLSSGDIIRFGEHGPELKVTITDGSAITAQPMGDQKVGVGKETLDRAISSATLLERSKNRRSIVMLLIILVAVAGAGAYVYIDNKAQSDQELQRVAAETREAKEQADAANKAIAGIQELTEKALAESMKRYELELNDLKGKIGAGESRIARLIVEIQQRDDALEHIKKRQDLSEAQRKKLLADTEKKLKGLKSDLAASEKKLRKTAGAPDWAGLAEKYRECLFLCYVESKPDEQGRVMSGTGTAFSIRKDGLLATNAHVAKMFLDDKMSVKVVIQNHTGKIFTVKKAKNHPGYKRANSPDVALVMVDTQGKSFPVMPLATREELKKLRIGTQLGTMGYPGELSGVYLSGFDQKSQTAKTALATFKDGWIGRITDFRRARADFATSYFIQHSASLSGGTSGSPMFDTNGKVIALNNSGLDLMVSVKKGEKAGTERTPSAAEIGNAIRVDLLLDLLKSSKW